MAKGKKKITVVSNSSAITQATQKGKAKAQAVPKPKKKTIAQVKKENEAKAKEEAEAKAKEENRKQKARDKKKRQKQKKDAEMVERVNQAEQRAEIEEALIKVKEAKYNIIIKENPKNVKFINDELRKTAEIGIDFVDGYDDDFEIGKESFLNFQKRLIEKLGETKNTFGKKGTLFSPKEEANQDNINELQGKIMSSFFDWNEGYVRGGKSAVLTEKRNRAKFRFKEKLGELRQQRLGLASRIEGTLPLLREQRKTELGERRLGVGEVGLVPQPNQYDRVGQRKTFTDESAFLLNELGRLEERALGKRFEKYAVGKNFNQPNSDKFGLKDDGTSRSRREFAHRFRGKTEKEVSDMIDQEVRDRTPAQRGAFMGRANRVIEGQDITERRGVGIGVDAGGVARVGAGEFISSELARQDIEQIEPKSVGFIGKEFTPDNMRRVGAMSKEETERGEGLLGIRQRREQQYKKEWSADGTTLRNYGFGVLDQERIRSVKERTDVMLNAVAMNIQALTEGKTPIIEADEKKSFQEDEKTFGRRGTQETEKYLTRKSNMGNIKVEFRQTDPYIQAQNNYALQGRFIDIFEKEPNTLQYLESMKDANGVDFVSGGGYKGVNYVDTSLTMYKQDPSTGFNPYLERFNLLKSSGREPLQFLLNTANNSILKFESDKPIAQEGIYNGVGNIAVMNEVMMGGRVAFIGHTLGGADPNIVSGAKQQGSALGYSMGFINVFNNPFIPEENNIQPMIEQNQIVDMTTPRTDIYNIATRDTTTGIIDLSGGDITLEESYRKSIIDYNTGNVRGEKIFVDSIEQGGKNETQPYPEQIRKGTFLPTKVAQDSGRRLKANLRTQQLRASSFPTSALQRKKRFGFQMFN